MFFADRIKRGLVAVACAAAVFGAAGWLPRTAEAGPQRTVCAAAGPVDGKAAMPDGEQKASPVWESLLRKYRKVREVRQLIFVQHTTGSRAWIRLYSKRDGDGDWEELLACSGFVGEKGIDKQREGDKRTPTGDFGVITACGTKENPGTVLNLPYLRLEKGRYGFSREPSLYNRLIDTRQEKVRGRLHTAFPEPQFCYGVFLDFNKEREWNRGSGIFLHCIGEKPYTAGCVSVPLPDMRFILQHISKNVRVCIFDR